MKWSEVALLGFLALSLVLVGATVVGNLQEAVVAGDASLAEGSRPSNFVLPTPLATEIKPTAAVQEQGEDPAGAVEQDEAPELLPTMDCSEPTADC